MKKVSRGRPVSKIIIRDILDVPVLTWPSIYFIIHTSAATIAVSSSALVSMF